MTGNASGKLLLVAIACFVVVAMAVNSSWLYDPYGWVDQWAYLGQGYFFPRIGKVWEHPASELLPLILPIALSYKLLPPAAANYALDFFFVTLVLCLVFAHVRRFADTASAASVAFLAGGYQYLLSALGSDYTDSRVIPCYCLGLYLISLARDAHGRRQALLLTFAGAAYAGMVYTAILAATYLPVLGLYFVLRIRSRIDSAWVQFIRRCARFLTWFPLGFVGVTLLLGACHYLCVGSWFFFKNNILKLLYFVGGGYSAPPADTWLPDASWLILPSAVALASGFMLRAMTRKYRGIKSLWLAFEERESIALLNVVSLAIMLFIELYAHQWSLQFLYFDQTLPVTLLGLGALLGRPIRRGQSSPLTAEVLTAALGSIACLWIVGHYPFTYASLRDPLSRLLNTGAYSTLALVILLTAAVVYFTNRHRFGRFAAIGWLLVLNVFSFSPTFGPFLYQDTWAKTTLPAPIDSAQGVFVWTLRVAEFVDRLDPQRQCSIWYNDAGPYGRLLRQFHSVAYVNDARRRINHSFPSLEDFSGFMGSEGHAPQPGETILVLSLDPQAASRAEAALHAKGFSIRHSIVSQLRIRNVTLFAVRLELSRDKAQAKSIS